MTDQDVPSAQRQAQMVQDQYRSLVNKLKYNTELLKVALEYAEVEDVLTFSTNVKQTAEAILMLEQQAAMKWKG